MARYHEIADDLRRRIQEGEWEIGAKLPGISALQDEYKVEKSLGTIRSAQQLLVADGMLRTEQGVGAFVTATEPVRVVTDLAETLAEAGKLINDALAAVRHPKGKVTFELTDDQYFVLDTALRDFASRSRAEAADAAGEQDPMLASNQQRWAEAAERMLEVIDAALG
jgi:DNA-binding transcriptional MocR family regulator